MIAEKMEHLGAQGGAPWSEISFCWMSSVWKHKTQREGHLGPQPGRDGWVRSVRWIEGVIRSKPRRETDAGLAHLSHSCGHALPPGAPAEQPREARLQRFRNCSPWGSTDAGLVVARVCPLFLRKASSELLKDTANEPHTHHLTQVGSDLLSFHENHVLGVRGVGGREGCRPSAQRCWGQVGVLRVRLVGRNKFRSPNLRGSLKGKQRGCT